MSKERWINLTVILVGLLLVCLMEVYYLQVELDYKSKSLNYWRCIVVTNGDNQGCRKLNP